MTLLNFEYNENCHAKQINNHINLIVFMLSVIVTKVMFWTADTVF